MARYIYSMWPPEVSPDEEALEQRVQWQINALEFSYANVAEGEVAGLFAFGDSYIEGTFTGRDWVLAVALLQAAYDCGLKSERIESLILNYRPTVQIPESELESLTTSFAARCRSMKN